MSEEHPLFKSLVGDLLRFPNGRLIEHHQFRGWNLEITTERSRRWIMVSIKATNTLRHEMFEKYAITKTPVLSLFTNTNSFQSEGNTSKYSDLILSSKQGMTLLSYSKAFITIDGTILCFKGRIRRRNETALITIVTHVEKLLEQIDSLNI